MVCIMKKMKLRKDQTKKFKILILWKEMQQQQKTL